MLPFLSFKKVSSFNLSLSQWYLPRRQKLKRAVALLIALCFVLPTVSWAFTVDSYFYPDMQNIRLGDKGSKQLALDYSIPAHLGKVVEAGFAPGDLTFILIQDLHCNYEIQSNIQAMLNRLIRRHPEIKLVAVEGASGIIPTMELAYIPDSPAKRAVADYFMREGKLTGADCLVICDRPAIELFGAEDGQLYDRSLELIQEFTTAENQGLILELMDQLDMLQDKIYNPQLLAWEQRRRAYLQGNIGTEEYHYSLIQNARSLRIPEIPPVLRKSGRRHNLDYQEREIQAQYLETEIRARLAKSVAERRLIEYQDFVEILERILNVSAAREDILKYQTQSRKISLKLILKELKASLGDIYFTTVEDMDMLETAVGKSLKFYQLAEERNHALLGNAAQRARSRKEQHVVLVTGGFHTPAIIDLIKAQGQSYVSLRPAMTKVDTSSNYFELLRNPEQPTDLERLLAAGQATPTSAMAVINLVNTVLFKPAVKFIREKPAKMYRSAIHRMQSGPFTLKRTEKKFIEASTSGGDKIGFSFERIWRIVGLEEFGQIPQTSLLASERMRVGALALLGLSLIVVIPAVLGVLGVTATGVVTVGLAGFGLSVAAGMLWSEAKYMKAISEFFRQNPNALKGVAVTTCILLALLPLYMVAGAAAAETSVEFAGAIQGVPAATFTPTLAGVHGAIGVALNYTPGIEGLSIQPHSGQLGINLKKMINLLGTIFPVFIFGAVIDSIRALLVTDPKIIENTQDKSFLEVQGMERKKIPLGKIEQEIEYAEKFMYGNKVDSWQDLPSRGYDVVIEEKHVITMRKILNLLGMAEFQKKIGTRLFFKNNHFQGILSAGIDELIKGDTIELAPSLTIVRPKPGMFDPISEVDNYNPAGYRAKIGEERWKEYLEIWDKKVVQPAIARGEADLFITKKQLEDLSRIESTQIAQMGNDEKAHLGTIIEQYHAMLHEIFHFMAHELVFLREDVDGVKRPWWKIFARHFAQDPGIHEYKSNTRVLEEEPWELMGIESFLETFCNKGSDVLLKLAFPYNDELKLGLDEGVKKVIELFDGQVSPELEAEYIAFMEHIKARSDLVLKYKKKSNITNGPIYKASTHTITSGFPEETEELRLNVNISWMKAITRALFIGIIVTFAAHSILFGFIGGIVYGLWQIAKVGFFAIYEGKKEKIDTALKDWQDKKEKGPNKWLKEHSWIGQLCETHNFELDKLRIMDEKGSVFRQFLSKGFSPANFVERTDKNTGKKIRTINLHPVFLILPRIFAESLLIHELKHLEDIQASPTRPPEWQLELRAEHAALMAIILYPKKIRQEKNSIPNYSADITSDIVKKVAPRSVKTSTPIYEEGMFHARSKMPIDEVAGVPDSTPKELNLVSAKAYSGSVKGKPIKSPGIMAVELTIDDDSYRRTKTVMPEVEAISPGNKKTVGKEFKKYVNAKGYSRVSTPDDMAQVSVGVEQQSDLQEIPAATEQTSDARPAAYQASSTDTQTTQPYSAGQRNVTPVPPPVGAMNYLWNTFSRLINATGPPQVQTWPTAGRIARDALYLWQAAKAGLSPGEVFTVYMDNEDLLKITIYIINKMADADDASYKALQTAIQNGTVQFSMLPSDKFGRPSASGIKATPGTVILTDQSTRKDYCVVRADKTASVITSSLMLRLDILHQLFPDAVVAELLKQNKMLIKSLGQLRNLNELERRLSQGYVFLTSEWLDQHLTQVQQNQAQLFAPGKCRVFNGEQDIATRSDLQRRIKAEMDKYLARMDKEKKTELHITLEEIQAAVEAASLATEGPVLLISADAEVFEASARVVEKQKSPGTFLNMQEWLESTTGEEKLRVIINELMMARLESGQFGIGAEELKRLAEEEVSPTSWFEEQAEKANVNAKVLLLSKHGVKLPPGFRERGTPMLLRGQYMGPVVEGRKLEFEAVGRQPVPEFTTPLMKTKGGEKVLSLIFLLITAGFNTVTTGFATATKSRIENLRRVAAAKARTPIPFVTISMHYIIGITTGFKIVLSPKFFKALRMIWEISSGRGINISELWVGGHLEKSLAALAEHKDLVNKGETKNLPSSLQMLVSFKQEFLQKRFGFLMKLLNISSLDRYNQELLIILHALEETVQYIMAEIDPAMVIQVELEKLARSKPEDALRLETKLALVLKQLARKPSKKYLHRLLRTLLTQAGNAADATPAEYRYCENVFRLMGKVTPDKQRLCRIRLSHAEPALEVNLPEMIFKDKFLFNQLHGMFPYAVYNENNKLIEPLSEPQLLRFTGAA
ncbi:hypothetical protein KAR34_00145 [bacterium]|nr:hypothetical protein [bacterium]